MQFRLVEDESFSDQAIPKILVAICSCQAYSDKRQAVRETWLANPQTGVEHRFFVGGGGTAENEQDTVVLDCDDSYDHLPAKVLAFFAHALASSDFDWLFKCDDDTYLALDRIHELIGHEYELVGNDMVATRGSPSGGAGYLLSRRIVEVLVGDSQLSQTGAEDIIIGEAAIRHGALPHATDLLRWDATKYPHQDNPLISAHWCSPERLKAIHTFFHESPVRLFKGVHVEWIDEIHLYANGVFRRKSSGCYGTWIEDENRSLALRWFDWGEEILHFDGTVYSNSAFRMNELADPRFKTEVQSIQDIPHLNLRNSKSQPRILYFCPVGATCLGTATSTAKAFRKAGADIRLVAYGEDSIRYPGIEILGPMKGGKWQIAKAHLKPEEIAEYDYIFVWDDDVRIDSFNPSRFVEIMRMNRLDMAQPAILSQHGLSHEITRPSDLPDFGLPKHRTAGRLTNFVEVMAPAFSREAWKTFHPFISETNRMGWGYDYFPFNRRGIVDIMTVEHMRPVSSEGNESKSDMEAYLGQHGLLKYTPGSIGHLFGPK